MFRFRFFRFQNSLTIANDPGTSDDSGRASERLTTSSVAPRDADSSRDRLSDVSIIFHCSSFVFMITWAHKEAFESHSTLYLRLKYSIHIHTHRLRCYFTN